MGQVGGWIRSLDGPGCLQVKVDLGWTKAVASVQTVRLGPVTAHGDPRRVQNVSLAVLKHHHPSGPFADSNNTSQFTHILKIHSYKQVLNLTSFQAYVLTLFFFPLLTYFLFYAILHLMYPLSLCKTAQ